MATILGVLGVLVVLYLAAALATRDGQILAPAPRDRPDSALPDGTLTGDDLDRARFGLALRGYRMAEVDELLDRAAAELRARDEQIADLTRAPDVAPEAAGE